MTGDSIKALKRMVKERTNPEESRNALLQLLKRGLIEPDEVMEFVDAYQEHKKLRQPIDMPQSIKCYVGISYSAIQNSIQQGYNYCPSMLVVAPSGMAYYDEVFEVDLPLNGFKQVTAVKVKN